MHPNRALYHSLDRYNRRSSVAKADAGPDTAADTLRKLLKHARTCVKNARVPIWDASIDAPDEGIECIFSSGTGFRDIYPSEQRWQFEGNLRGCVGIESKLEAVTRL